MVVVDFVLAQNAWDSCWEAPWTENASILRQPALKFMTVCFDVMLDALETLTDGLTD